MVAKSGKKTTGETTSDIGAADYLDIMLRPDGAMTIYVRTEGNFLPLILQELREAGIQVHARFRSPCG